MPRLKNPRQEAVAQLKAQAYLDPENAPSDTEIVQKVYGYSRESAESNAVTVMGSKGVQTRLEELIAEKMPDSALARKGKQLFEAKKSVIDKRTGKVIVKVADNGVQLETWKTLLKMRGLLNDGTTIDNRSINMMPPESFTALASSIDRLDKLADKLCKSSGLNELEDIPSSAHPGGGAVNGPES